MQGIANPKKDDMTCPLSMHAHPYYLHHFHTLAIFMIFSYTSHSFVQIRTEMTKYAAKPTDNLRKVGIIVLGRNSDLRPVSQHLSGVCALVAVSLLFSFT